MGALTTTALIGLSVGKGAFDLVSAGQQARAQRELGAYQAKRLEMNAGFLDIQAKDAVRRGNVEAQNYQDQVASMLGTQRAQFAASGVSVNSGSAADIQVETAVRGAEDVVTIRNNAWLESWGHRVQAADMRQQARLTRMGAETQASNTMLTGIASSVGSFARGVSIAADSNLFKSEGNKASAGTSSNKGPSTASIGNAPKRSGYQPLFS